jgi:starvation-inducible DNA-binding protein
MINIGLNNKQLTAVIETLGQYLGSLYVLSIKTQGYHWNIIDPNFKSLHEFFGELYEKTASPIDTVAERIRSLGELAPATLGDMLELSILEDQQSAESAVEMLQSLLTDHETLIQNLREWVEISENNNDKATADFYIERITEHEKMAWMLRSSL